MSGAAGGAPVDGPRRAGLHANAYAIGAIALWAGLASLALTLRHVPPFLLTGIALVVGSVPAWPLWRQWRVPPATLALGIGGLFGYHFVLFLALRVAPPVEANLVNYLWPLLIVVLAPLVLPGLHLRARHVAAALVGFAGAALAIVGSSGGSLQGGWSWGYLLALAAAFLWALFSLLTRRVPPFPNAAIGLFGLVSGLLSLACHALLEPPVALTARDLGLLAVLGLGPMGAAFFLWDKALKGGDARQIGVLSYATPVASTLLLLLVSGRALTWSIAAAAGLIIAAAILGTREPAGEAHAGPRTP